MPFEQSLSVDASESRRADRYRAVRRQLESMLEDEPNWVAAMATAASHLHRAFAYYDWTGFYRHVEPELLVVGPYQGPVGCLRIPFSDGICGAAARQCETQFVDDVSERDDHIACSASTQSEIVVPVAGGDRELAAVLDVDSDHPAAFAEVDREHLEAVARDLGRSYDVGAPG